MTLGLEDTVARGATRLALDLALSKHGFGWRQLVMRVNARDAPDGPASDRTEAVLERQARAIGYSGKPVADSRHLAAVSRMFTSSPKEVERAERLVHVYREAGAAGVGMLGVGGRALDAARVRIARRVVRRAERAAAMRLRSKA